MSRWFIAVFALHFAASVLLSTLGLAQPRTPDAGAQPAAWSLAASLDAWLDTAEAAPASHPTSLPVPADTLSLLDDYDHALMDDQQDLPDILHEDLALVRLRQPACAHVPGLARPGPSRALAPLDRPPRGRPLLA
jgi:hypothetical protein